MRNHLRYTLIGISVLVGSWLLFYLPISKPLLQIADLRIYDTIVDFANALANDSDKAVYDDICIVDIDEKSISAMGQSAVMQRFLFADLIDVLAADEPIAIGFDVFFTESDSIMGYARTRLKQKLNLRDAYAEDVINNLSSDSTLANAIERSGNVYLAMFNSIDSSPPTPLPDKLVPWVLQPKSYLPLTNLHPPIDILSRAANGIGFAHVEPDESGIIHDYPLFLGYQGRYFVNFSFQMGLDLLGVDRITANNTCRLYSGDKLVTNIPLSSDGRCFFKYYGPQKSFRYISFYDVLRQRTPPGYFKDRIVLVGSSASGLRDIKSTSLDSNYPGVELHATFLRNLLEGDFIHWLNPYWLALIDIILLLFLTWVIRNAKPLISIGVFSVLTILIFPLFYFLYMRYSLCLPYSYILLPWIVGFVTVFSIQSHDQLMEKKKVRNAFEHYVSVDVISQIMKGSQNLAPGGEKKTISILFADVRNFTTYCERLSPTEITRFMNRYFNDATKIIMSNRGLLDKFIGDAVLALFGAPLPYAEFAVNAVKTALQLRDISQDIRYEFREHPVLKDFRIGIGVATGEVIVGNIGSDTIFNYTGIGDRMNFCSRLESLNKFYRTSVIIDECTHNLIKHIFLCRLLDRVTVKGKAIISNIYEVVDYHGIISTDSPDYACYTAYECAMKHISDLRFNEAKESLLKAQENNEDDYPTKLMLKRLEEINPITWDGVWQHSIK